MDGADFYAYDGHRWKMQQTVSGATTTYIYSGSQVLAEYPAGAAPTAPGKEYVYAGGKLLATIAGGATTYQYPDQLSTRVETDSAGNVTRTFGHLPFGEVWYETGTASKWKFTSYERDTSEPQLDYAMNRFYAYGFGRFQSADPYMGSMNPMNPQSMNRYAYAGNNPMNIFDPLGLVWVYVTQQFCVNSGSGDHCTNEGDWQWFDEASSGPLEGGGRGGGGGAGGGSGSGNSGNGFPNINPYNCLPEGQSGPRAPGLDEHCNVVNPCAYPIPCDVSVTMPYNITFTPGLGQILACFAGADPELFNGQEPKHVPEESAAQAAVFGISRSPGRTTEQINGPQVEQANAYAGAYAYGGNLANCLAAH